MYKNIYILRSLHHQWRTQNNMIWIQLTVPLFASTKPPHLLYSISPLWGKHVLYLCQCNGLRDYATDNIDRYTYIYIRVCFSTNLPTNRRISPFLDNPHLPSFACDSKPYSTYRIWIFIVIDPLLKKFPIYPSVDYKCLIRIWRMQITLRLHRAHICLAAILPLAER